MKNLNIKRLGLLNNNFITFKKSSFCKQEKIFMTFNRNISRICPKIIATQKRLYRDNFSRLQQPRTIYNTKNEIKFNNKKLSNNRASQIPAMKKYTQY